MHGRQHLKERFKWAKTGYLCGMIQEVICLSNGLRVVYKQVPSVVAHCGFVVDVGTRDERSHEHGLAHFLEHMLFKGTSKRTAFHILNRLELVGGELNAYTTKEKTSVYASLMDTELPRAVDLLCDILFRSQFPEREIHKERQVVVDEIRNYEDIYEELIYDEFDVRCFPDHALGHFILGTEQSLASMDRGVIDAFYKRHYRIPRMVFSYVGPSSLDRVRKLLERHLSDVAFLSSEEERNLLKPRYTPFQDRLSRSISQDYVLLGYPAPSTTDKMRVPMLLLNNILGADNMNSRLNLSVRERRGLVYTIESNYTSYIDSGLLQIYFSCDPEKVKKVRKLCMQEFDALCQQRIPDQQMRRHIRQFQSRVAMGEESRQSLMLALGKNLLDFGRIDTLEELLDQISQVTAEQIRELAGKMFSPEGMSELTIAAE